MLEILKNQETLGEITFTPRELGINKSALKTKVNDLFTTRSIEKMLSQLTRAWIKFDGRVFVLSWVEKTLVNEHWHTHSILGDVTLEKSVKIWEKELKSC